ncbi:MAG: phage tail tape measure protein [Candidatus Binatia bacterium]
MVRIQIGVGGESRAATQAINAVTKQLKEMQKQLGELGKSAAQNNQIMAKGFAGLAGTTQNLTAEIKTLGGVKEKELTFRKQTTDAKQFALQMINLRDAGSAFVIMSQQLGQALEEIREDFVEWDQLVQQTAVLTTEAGKEINFAIRSDIIAASNEMARTFALDTKQVVTGLREVVAMGFEFEEAALIMRAAAFTAVGGLGEIADTSKFLVNVMRAFGDELENINIIAATTTFIANETSLQITDMGIAMQFVASTAGAMGFELGEVAAALGVMTDAGLGASIAGTSLNRFLTQLARAGADANITLESLGIEVADQEGNFLSLSQIFRNTSEAIREMDKRGQTQALNALFGIRGQRAANLIRETSLENMEDLIEQMKMFETEEEAIAFLTQISNGMLANQAAQWVRTNTAVEQNTRVMAEAAIPLQIQFNGLLGELLRTMADLPPGFREIAAGGLVVAQSMLGMSGQIFLLVTSVQTAGKSLWSLIAAIKAARVATTSLTSSQISQTNAVILQGSAYDKAIFKAGIYNKKMLVSTNRTRALGLAAGAAGLAMGAMAFTMSGASAESKEQAITSAALAAVTWAMAGAMAAAAIANAGLLPPPLGIGSAIAMGAILAATIGGLVTLLSSEAGRMAVGLQEGAFFPGRPGRGTLFRAGEGVEGEILAPETMLRRVFREEMRNILIQQDISRDQFNFEVTNFGQFSLTDALLVSEMVDDARERRRLR